MKRQTEPSPPRTARLCGSSKPSSACADSSSLHLGRLFRTVPTGNGAQEAVAALHSSLELEETYAVFGDEIQTVAFEHRHTEEIDTRTPIAAGESVPVALRSVEWLRLFFIAQSKLKIRPRWYVEDESGNSVTCLANVPIFDPASDQVLERTPDPHSTFTRHAFLNF